MTPVSLTPYQLAQRFVGIKEAVGHAANPQILAMLQLDDTWPQEDEVPWCSAFVNYVTWLLRLPRSKSLAARSWLSVGTPVTMTTASVGFDVVVLSRGSGGHVGFFSACEQDRVWMLSGNQGDTVCVASFETSRVLGIRRLGGE